MFSINKRRTWLYFVEKVRMVTDLLKLHEYVEKFDLISNSVYYINIASEDILVELLL